MATAVERNRPPHSPLRLPPNSHGSERSAGTAVRSPLGLGTETVRANPGCDASVRPVQGCSRLSRFLDRVYSGAIIDTPEFLVHCATADEADRALGLGLAIETTPQVAVECSAPKPGEADPGDPLEDVLEAHLDPDGRDREESV